jgi:small basic protein (TIGR04137 family)
MSLHKSLVTKSALTRQRNVLTREERIARLIKEGKLKEGESIFGLPKVAPIRMKKRVKEKKKKEEEGALAGVPGAEGAAVPGAAAAPAAGAGKATPTAGKAAPAAGKGATAAPKAAAPKGAAPKGEKPSKK